MSVSETINSNQMAIDVIRARRKLGEDDMVVIVKPRTDVPLRWQSAKGILPLSPFYTADMNAQFVNGSMKVSGCHPLLKSPGGHAFLNLGIGWDKKTSTPEVYVLTVGCHATRNWGEDAIEHAGEGGALAIWMPMSEVPNMAYQHAALSHLYAAVIGEDINIGNSDTNSSAIDYSRTRSIWCMQCGGANFSSFYCEGIPQADGSMAPCNFSLCHFCGKQYLEDNPDAVAMGKIALISHYSHTDRLIKNLRFPRHTMVTRPTLVILFTFIDSDELWEMPHQVSELLGLPPVGCGYSVLRFRCTTLDHARTAIERMEKDLHVLEIRYHQVVFYIAAHNDPSTEIAMIVTDAFVQEIDDDMSVDREMCIAESLLDAPIKVIIKDAEPYVYESDDSMASTPSTPPAGMDTSISMDEAIAHSLANRRTSARVKNAPVITVGPVSGSVARVGKKKKRCRQTNKSKTSSNTKSVKKLPGVANHKVYCDSCERSHRVCGRKQPASKFHWNELAAVLAPFIQKVYSRLPSSSRDHVSVVVCSCDTRAEVMAPFFEQLGMAESVRAVSLGIATDRPSTLTVFAQWQVSALRNYCNAVLRLSPNPDDHDVPVPRTNLLRLSEYSASGDLLTTLTPRPYYRYEGKIVYDSMTIWTAKELINQVKQDKAANEGAPTGASGMATKKRRYRMISTM